jgi:hypothetical protein
MGMFTTILHDDNDIQIKIGWDACGVYKIGDRIEWSPDPGYPGGHIDGVHDSYDSKHLHPWIVIKDCVVVAVEPRSQSGEDDVKRLEAQYGIKEPDPALWTAEQWKAKADRDAAYEAAYQKWAKVNGDNPIGYYLHLKLSERSFANQIFRPIKVRKK